MKPLRHKAAVLLTVLYTALSVGFAHPCLCARLTADAPAGCCCAQKASCEPGDCCCGCRWESPEESPTRAGFHIYPDNDRFENQYICLITVLPGDGPSLPDVSEGTAVFFKCYIPPERQNEFPEAVSHRGPLFRINKTKSYLFLI